MLVPKILYFLFYFIVGIQLVFFSLFYQELGLSSHQIGVLFGLQGIAVVISPLVSSHFADSSHLGPRSMILLNVFLVGVLFFVMSLQDNFYILGLVTFCFGLFYTPLFSLFDGIALSFIDRLHPANDHIFAKTRVWGSIGFIVSATCISSAVDYLGMSYTTAIRCASLSSFILCLYIALNRVSLIFTERSFERSALPSREAFKKMFSSPVVFFVASSFCISTSMGTLYAFFPLYLESRSIPKSTIGLLYNVGIISEALLFLCSAPLLKRFGIRNLLIFGAGSTALRFLILTGSPSLFLIICSQILHAPIILILSVVVNIYLNKVSETKYRYSMLGLQQMLSGGVARFVGSAGFTTVLTFIGFTDTGTVSGIFILACLVGFLSIVFAFLFREISEQP